MVIRPYDPADLPELVDLTVETFRPFFTDHVRPLFGEELFRLQHGQWQQDYHDELSTLHDPAAHRWLAVAATEDAVAGLVAWHAGPRPEHGVVQLLAVTPAHRRQGVGRRLLGHALDDLRARGVRVVEIGTGQDAFHGPARGLYESFGFTKVEIAGYVAAV